MKRVTNMTSTEQLEREAELSRARLASSLDELRAITPGRIMDEILGYAKSGSAELLRGLGNQVVEHPLPATLIGAGLAWLIMSNGSSSRSTAYDTATRTSSNGSWFSDTARSTSAAAGSVTDSIRDRAGSAVQGLKDTAQSAVSSVSDSMDSTAGMVREKAQSAIAGLSDTASGIGESISGAYDSCADTVSRTASSVAEAAARVTPSQDELMQAGQRIWDYCKEQPLVAAGLGVALGAALGAAVPQTDAENRLMGEAAGQLKDKAQRLASDQYTAARTVGEHIVDETAKLAKKELHNMVQGWESSNKSGDGGTVQSDQQQSGGQMGQKGSSQSGQRPIH